MSLVDGGFVFCAEAGQTNLRGGKAGGGEIDGGVFAGVEPLLNDADEAICEALLLLERGLTLHIAIEGEIGDGGVLGYAFTNVLEGEFGCIEGCGGRTEIIALGVAEDQGRRGDVED